MQILPKLTALGYVSPPTAVGNSAVIPIGIPNGSYILRYFRCRRQVPRQGHFVFSLNASVDYGDMLDSPYYNRDFEAEDYTELLEAEEAEEAKEEEMDEIDRQLLELEQEKKIYRNLNRMIARSAERELPKTTVETQRMFPPPKPNGQTPSHPPEDIPISKFLATQGQDSDVSHGDSGDHITLLTKTPGTPNSGNDSEGKPASDDVEVPPLKDQFDEYDPVKLPGYGNTTSELITGIIQIPNVKGFKQLPSTFKIKDYTKEEVPAIEEDHLWLKLVNEARREAGKPEIPLVEGQNLRDNPEFVKDLREVRLKRLKDLRTLSHQRRAEREALKDTFYRKLPRNDMGFAMLQEGDLPKLSYDEVKEELRARGHRTGGGEKMALRRLKEALSDKDDWRYKNIVKQPLDETNENLPEHSRQKLIELKRKMNLLEEAGWGGDLITTIERLKARQEVIHFNDDPVGYLELDINEPFREETPEELEEIKNAPVVHDTTFLDAMANPINRLPDIIPRTFNLQPDVERPYPEYHAMNKQELEDLKREYLSFEGGIHEMTLPEISRTYEISLDFLGDACCRLGAKPPVLLDMPLRGIISYSAIWDLIEFLNIADTLEVESFYTFLDIEKIAKELGKTPDDVKEACDRLKIKLPFGNKTKLNLHCLSMVEKLINNPETDVDFLVYEGSTKPAPFEDITDRRPVFPNSMQDDIYQAAKASGDIYDHKESYEHME